MAERRIGTRGLVALATSIATIGLVGALAYAPQPTTQSVRSSSVALASPSVALASPSASVGHASATPTGPSPSASNATPTPTDMPIPVPTIAFDSSVHDYQVRYPDGWTVAGADRKSDPDVITSADYRWTGTARRVAAGTSLEEFVGANAKMGCKGAAWDVTEIDGRHALRRAGCGRVDVDVMVGRDVYSFSLTGTGPYESVVLFGRIGSTIQLPEPFASRMNDFTISIPPAWDVRAASEPDDPDRFYGPRHLNLDVMTHRNAGPLRVVGWAEGHIHRRSVTRQGVQYCVANSGQTLVQDLRFRQATIDGHPAAIRSSCGYIDAAVLVGNRVVQLTLISPHRGPGGDDAAFAMLKRRVDLGTPDGIGPVWSQTFRSKLHGYTLRYPADWRVAPASDLAKNDVFRAGNARSSLSVTVRPKPRSQELDAFADDLLPHHTKDNGCMWGNYWIPGGMMSFKREVIAGHPAVVRNECDFVDAVVDLDDRALVLVLKSGNRQPTVRRPLFDLFASALMVAGSPV
jgi:hypothetical protein